jgi:ABC-type protease/lipase transport system fused ATPase/permease subunit
VAEPDGTIGENPLDAPAPRAMIELKEVTKYYPGSDIPAVAELTLDIPEGEILVSWARPGAANPPPCA